MEEDDPIIISRVESTIRAGGGEIALDGTRIKPGYYKMVELKTLVQLETKLPSDKS